MCRNITTLRGLEPAATPEEIQAAACQYVRKVSGVQSTTPQTEDSVRARRDRGHGGDGVAAGHPAAAPPAPTDPPTAAPDGRQVHQRLNIP